MYLNNFDGFLFGAFYHKGEFATDERDNCNTRMLKIEMYCI